MVLRQLLIAASVWRQSQANWRINTVKEDGGLEMAAKDSRITRRQLLIRAASSVVVLTGVGSLAGCAGQAAPAPTSAPAAPAAPAAAPTAGAAPTSAPTVGAAPTTAPTQAAAAASSGDVPMVGAIPDNVLNGTAPTPKFSGEIDLGAMYPRSGANAYLGEETWRGVELAMKVQNAKGGINGKEIKITIVDVPDTNSAVSAVQRLITQNHMQLIMGTFASASAYAASPIAERAGVIYYETNGTADNLTQRGFKYFFRASSPTANIATQGVSVTKDGLTSILKIPANQLKVAIIHEDGDWGTQSGNNLEKDVKAAGMQLLAREPYSATSVDLSPLVLKMKSLNPDVLLAASYTPDAQLFWKQCRDATWRPKALVGNGSGHTDTSFYKAFGSAANGVLDADFPQYDMSPKAAPGITQYIQLYKKTYNENMRGPQSLVAYTSASTLWDILARAGSLDPEAVRQAILATDIPIGKTPIGWGEKFAPPGDPNAGTNLRTFAAAMQWQAGGKFVTVWPKTLAAGDIQDIPLVPWSDVKS